MSLSVLRLLLLLKMLLRASGLTAESQAFLSSGQATSDKLAPMPWCGGGVSGQLIPPPTTAEEETNKPLLPLHVGVRRQVSFESAESSLPGLCTEAPDQNRRRELCKPCFADLIDAPDHSWYLGNGECCARCAAVARLNLK